MQPPNKTDNPQDFSDSDQQWFDRLSGKKLVVATDERALREADALRRALELERQAVASSPEIAAATTPAEEARRAQQLQFRLRREGLVGAPARSSKRWWQGAAAVAAALVMAVVLVPRGGGGGGGDEIYYNEPPTLRGEFNLVQRTDAHPKQAAEALAASLRAGGLQPSLHQLSKTFSVDVELLPDAGEPALAAFKQASLAPTLGLTRVEIAPK